MVKVEAELDLQETWGRSPQVRIEAVPEMRSRVAVAEELLGRVREELAAAGLVGLSFGTLAGFPARAFHARTIGEPEVLRAQARQAAGVLAAAIESSRAGLRTLERMDAQAGRAHAELVQRVTEDGGGLPGPAGAAPAAAA